YQATPAGQGSFVAWSPGRQFWFYKGNMPAPGSAVATRLATGRQQFDWAYDVSFVRNPAFPFAEPRLVARLHGNTPVAIADVCQAGGAGSTPTPPAARVTTQGPTQSSAVGLAAGVTVEPDAPLTLFPRGSDMRRATVLTGGGIGGGTRSAAGTW